MTISWFSDLICAKMHGALIPRIFIIHFLHTPFSKKHAFGLEGVFAAIDFVLRDCEADTVLVLCRHSLYLLIAELFSKVEEVLLFASLTWRVSLGNLSVLKLIRAWNEEAFVQLVSCYFVL